MYRFHELMQQLGYPVHGEDVELDNLSSPASSNERSLILISDKHHLHQKEIPASRAWLIAETLANDSLCQWLKDKNISFSLSPHPKLDLIRLMHIFYPEKPIEPMIHASVILGTNTRIGKNVHIEPYVVIGDNCSIGDNTFIGAHTVIGDEVTIGHHTTLHARVTIYSHVCIGHHAIIHAGTVIGSDGFGYTDAAGYYQKIPHKGSVMIGDEVEIGALCAVDRGTLDPTRIGNGTKMDNLIHIAHNVQIGEQTLIAAQVGIAGSTIIGRRVTIAGQAGLVDHITIGDNAVIGAQAGVIGSIPAGQTVSGYPAREHHQALRREALIGKIPELQERITRLEQQFRSKQPDTENR